jgi:hypothetical protein
VDSSFQILQTSFNSTTGISVGTPSGYTYPYTQTILYTNTGGESWNYSNVSSGDILDTENSFYGVYVYIISAWSDMAKPHQLLGPPTVPPD